MKLSATNKHVTQHFAMIEEPELKRILAEYVAKEVGVVLTNDHVDFTVLLRNRDTSYGVEKFVEVTIIEDWNKLPECAL